jgi:type IV pilus assembly protein PilC
MAEEKKQKDDHGMSANIGEENRSLFSYLNPFHNTITTGGILLFTKYFATLIKAGIPLLRCLATLSRQVSGYKFRKLIWNMRNEIEGGIPLNVTFKKNEGIFGLLYVNLIRVGEESGRLFNVLDRLCQLLDRQIKLRRRVLAALTYPAIITLVSVGVVSFLMIYVIPQFSKLFKQFGQELPMPTQVVINTSDFIVDNVLNIMAVALMFFLVMYQVNQSKGGRFFLDGLKLKVPLFGELIKKYNIALFARNLSVLFQSGVPIINGIRISVEVIDNVVLAEGMLHVLKEIEGGIPISRALAKTNLMPELSRQMIEVGEESGNLDEMLEKVAEFYEDEINFLVDQMAAMIEPAFIIVLGTLVGGIVVAMYLPIFRMARVVSGSAGVTTGGS